MREIKIRTWILWAVILFVVGVFADYFFWHLVLGQRAEDAATSVESPVTPSTSANSAAAAGVDNSFISDPANPAPTPAPSGKNNFRESLSQCAPTIAAQAISTPEALIEYLRKTVGILKEDVSVENYHLTLKDGSPRRVHVVLSDKSNGDQAKEVRYFKLDAEGYPERVPVREGETLESLLAQGNVTLHEVRSQLQLKDKSSVNLEMHNNVVFEFQYAMDGKILSCRYTDCLCP